MIWDIPLPRLLNASGGTERRIRPIKVSIDLKIKPLSYATMDLPVGESLPARGFVELYTCLGSAGIYRVRSPQDAFGDDIGTAELEHAIVETGDWIIQANLNSMMSAGAAMQAVFSHYRGTLWQLGSVSALGSVQVAVQQNHTRVLEALMAIMDQVPGCMFDFDFTTTPWTVSAVAKDTTVTAEGRLARNVNRARIIYDDAELCTRAYYEIPATTDASTENISAFDVNKINSAGAYVTYQNKVYTLPAGHEYGVTWENTQKTAVADAPTTTWTYMDADTIGTYGVIEQTVPTGLDYTQEEAEQAASEYLRQHKNPRITVAIDGEELSHITGEPLDTFRIGKLFRLALADYNTTVERNITGLSWPDVYDTPEAIVVNLEDEEETAVTFLHDLDAKGGYGGGGGGRREEEVWKEFRTAIEKSDYYIDLWARQYSQTEDILKQAGLYLDANRALLYADDNSYMIGNKVASLHGRIDVQADKIGMVVSGEGEFKSIKAAEIWASIDTTLRQSQITISADIIDIDGLLTAFESEAITCGDINCQGSLDVDQDIMAGGLVQAQTGSFDFLNVDGESASWQTYTARYCNMSTGHYFLYSSPGSATPSGGVQGYIASSYSNTTLHYLGYPDS